WSGLVPALEAALQPSDLLVLVTVRQGALSWRPGLSRLPRLLPQRFPEASLIFVYPSEVPFAAPPGAPPPPARAAAVDLRPAEVAFDLRGEAWEDVLAQVLPAADGAGRPWRAAA